MGKKDKLWQYRKKVICLLANGKRDKISMNDPKKSLGADDEGKSLDQILRVLEDLKDVKVLKPSLVSGANEYKVDSERAEEVCGDYDSYFPEKPDKNF